MGVCVTPTDCLTDVAAGVWGELADAVKESAGEMVTALFGWWTTTSSLDLGAPLVAVAQRYVTAWVAVPVAVLALIATVAWGVAGGGFAWLREAARGLVVFGVVAAGGLPVVAAVQEWSGSLASGLLDAVPAGDVGGRLIELLELPGRESITVLFWALVVLAVSAVQYLFMLFRDGAVLILSAALPVAAAGQFSRGSVLWLPRVIGWLLAFVFVKPAAALVYFLGLSLIGRAEGLQALATGVCVMVAAVLTLPALLRLVTFAIAAPQLGSGGLAGVATVTGMVTSVAHLRATRSAGQAAAPAGAPTASPIPAPAATGAAMATPAGAAVAAASSVRAVATRTARAGVDSNGAGQR